MMRKSPWQIGYIVIVLLSFFAFGALEAEEMNGTEEALTARRVRDFISLKGQQTDDGKFTLGHKVDDRSPGVFDDLDPGIDSSFVFTEESTIVLVDFNPLLQSYAVTATELDDPGYLALSKFLDAVSDFESAVKALGQEKSDVDGEVKAYGKRLAAQSGSNQVKCGALDKLAKSLDDVQKAMTADWIRSGFAREIAEKAVGLEGVGKAIEVIASKKTELDDKKTVLHDNLVNVGKIAAVEVPDTALQRAEGRQTPADVLECTNVIARSVARALTITLRYEASIEAIDNARASLVELEKVLKPHNNETLWRQKDSNTHPDRVIYRYKPKSDKLTQLEVTVKSRTLQGDDGRLTIKDSKTASSTLRLRKFQRVVPEIGVGFFYADLPVPKYGTEEVNGETVVALAREDELGVEPGAVLNLIPRWSRHSVFYPGLQLGVASGADSPSLLAGVVLRFLKPKNIALSGGWITTWYKDLNKLSVGDVVTGTAEIEADLHRVRESGAYFAIQYNWSLK